MKKKVNKTKPKTARKREIIESKPEKVKISKQGLDGFFKAENLALIGASHEINKIGNVLFKNLIKTKTVFPVNPNIDVIMNRHSFKSVLEIEDKIDMAIIAVKAELVPEVVEQCGKKKIKNVLIISSGFAEAGNEKLNEKLKNCLEKYDIKCIGPNCLGIYDAYSDLDAIFLTQQRLKRPTQGKISFISQSGALGGALLGTMADRKIGISKFVSYGNAINLNECDYLEYLGNDPETSVICVYVEQIKDGKRFLEIGKKVAKEKPIIVLKGGMTEKGNKAAMSHTGSLAGDARIYSGILKQIGAIQVDNLEDLFSVANLFDKFYELKKKIKGKKIQVITNGGGYGIICADQIEKNKLELGELSSATVAKMKKFMPTFANIGNPMDLMGDVTNERYRLALDACLDDANIDLVLLVVLYQTPLINQDLVEIISQAQKSMKKPIVIVMNNNEFEESIKETLEEKEAVVFEFPEDAVRAIQKFLR
jgi:acyl-CoA synthetase (NDP forming)